VKNFVLVFGGIGTILLAIAGFVFFREQSFLNTAEAATGTVTDFNLSSNSDGSGGTYCPVIDFTTNAGEAVKYYANMCSSPPSYDVGEQVEVLYDAQNIKNVQMKGFWSQYTAVVVLGFIGAPFFLAGLWGLFAGRKKS
jgi:hypothetical protein